MLDTTDTQTFNTPRKLHRPLIALLGITLLATCLTCYQLHSSSFTSHADGHRSKPSPPLSVPKASYDLIYYYDIEPKEQKYLRLAKSYEEMVRRQHAEVAATSKHQKTTNTNAVALKTTGDDDESSHPLALTHRLLAPTTTSGLTHTGRLGGMVLASNALVTQQDAEALRSKIKSLKTQQLRRMLADKAARCDGCVDKHHLIERVLEVRGWLSRDDTTAMAMTVLQDSAAQRMLPFHMGEELNAEQSATIVAMQQQEAVMHYMYDCDEFHPENRTIVCVPRVVV